MSAFAAAQRRNRANPAISVPSLTRALVDGCALIRYCRCDASPSRPFANLDLTSRRLNPGQTMRAARQRQRKTRRSYRPARAHSPTSMIKVQLSP